MSKKHYYLILITFLFGSAYPVQKLIFNENVPPIMGSFMMFTAFICLIPFGNLKFLKKNIGFLIILFFNVHGNMANLFMTLSLKEAAIVSPIIIGSQLAIPFAILLSLFLK